MLEFLFYILAGGSVGFIVGVTGVGGGSFMTPILLGFGFAPTIAVGTDLLYAAITKSNGIITHQKQKTIDWPIVLTLSSGSLPACLTTIALLHIYQINEQTYNQLMTKTLGVMLIVTGFALLFRNLIQKRRNELASTQPMTNRITKVITFIMGIALGILVTLSSVGAGAFGAAILLTLYPRISTIKVIGTDLAHAVPLTTIAGLGHWHLGHINWFLLAGLIVGSLPAIWLGTRIGYRLSDKILQPIMVFILIGIGLKYTLL